MAAAAHFDRAAATWDENPVRRALTAAIAAAIGRRVPLHGGMAVLEYGCGTANLSFLLAPRVGPITAADTSEGMLTQVRRKLAEAGPTPITPVRLDLAQDPLPEERFDLVTTAMVLHHVEDTGRLLRAFRVLLRPRGWLALADLCAEDGSFHGEMAVPHRGFDPLALGTAVERCGFQDVRAEVIHVIPKQGREYPVFLLTARAPGGP